MKFWKSMGEKERKVFNFSLIFNVAFLLFAYFLEKNHECNSLDGCEICLAISSIEILVSISSLLVFSSISGHHFKVFMDHLKDRVIELEDDGIYGIAAKPSKKVFYKVHETLFDLKQQLQIDMEVICY